MSQIRLYFEGNSGLKRPFQFFLERANPQFKGKIKAIPGKGRDDAIYDFLLSVSRYPDLSHILLVDSEGPDDDHLFDRLKEEASWRPRGMVPGKQQVA